MNFSVEEENLICMYHTSDRRRTMARMLTALPDMDTEMRRLANGTIAKLEHMTDLELVLTMLAEASTTDISKTAKPQTFEENKQVAKRGGKVAGIARQALEAETGKPVITEKNAFDFQQLVTDIVEDAAELPENPTEKKDKD